MTVNLNDRFKVLETISCGTYGTTYRVSQEKVLYVLKTFEVPNTNITFADVAHVVDKVKQCVHRSVLRCLQAFQLPVKQSNLLRFSLLYEYCEQGNLEGLIEKRQGRRFRNKRVQSWMKQMSSALAFLHDRNMLHGDIKLSNVLVDRKDNLKLADFFLLRKIAHWTGTKTDCPGFEAPETRTGGYRFESDVYSMGCVFLCIVTLETSPLQADGTFQTFPPNVTYGKTKMTSVRDCLERDPELRPTASAVYHTVKDDCYQSLSFSSVHGYNINLSEDRLVARRDDPALRSDGIIFSSRPLQPAEKFRIRISETWDTEWPDIAFGFTSANPERLQGSVPSALTELQKSHKLWYTVKKIQNARGAHLVFWFEQSGRILYVVNEKVHVSSFSLDPSSCIWAAVHIYQGIRKVQLADQNH